MTQLTLRIAEHLVTDLKRAAAASGKSLNAWVTVVLTAAVDPDLEGDEARRVRERLARAGLLMVLPEQNASRPAARAVERARAAAGRGKSLAEIVTEDRI